MTKVCVCCNKEFVKTAKNYDRIFCNDCAKKIKREVHKRRIRENPFLFWKWNITTTKEVDEIVKSIQKELKPNV